MEDYEKLMWIDLEMELQDTLVHYLDSAFDIYDVKNVTQVWGQQDDFVSCEGSDQLSSGMLLLKPQADLVTALQEQAKKMQKCLFPQHVIQQYFHKPGHS